jgi:hypothetical protein
VSSKLKSCIQGVYDSEYHHASSKIISLKTPWPVSYQMFDVVQVYEVRRCL